MAGIVIANVEVMLELSPPTTLVLIVEDAEELREGMAEILRMAGFDVETAMDGRDGLAKLEGMRAMPSAILSDREMPHMSGPEMIAAIRRQERLASIPIAVISGTVEDVPGANRIVRKPLDPKALTRMVNELCASARPLHPEAEARGR